MANAALKSRSGQVLVAVALLVPLALLPIAAYAIEAARLAATEARLQEAATRAVEAGAAQLDADRLRSGSGFALDPAAARRVALAEMAVAEPAAEIDSAAVSGNELNLAVRESVRLDLGGFLSVGVVNVRARVSARLTPGYDSPSSRSASSTGSV